MSAPERGSFWAHVAVELTVAGAGVALALWLPEALEARRAALVGVLLAAGTGTVGLVLKRRAVRRDLASAFKVVGLVFGMRALGVGVGLVAVVRQGWSAVGFVAGFFATYFVLQVIEMSYVMAASRNAAGGGE